MNTQTQGDKCLHAKFGIGDVVKHETGIMGRVIYIEVDLNTPWMFSYDVEDMGCAYPETEFTLVNDQ